MQALQIQDRLGTFRPRGRYSLTDAVDLVSSAIAECRQRAVGMLLIDGTGFVDLAIPTLIDRFLMVEDWAHEAKGLVVVALVVPVQYIHPQKFGIKVALEFGLICDVFSSEEQANAWLSEVSTDAARGSR